jgi:hypothetical protein
MTDPRSKPGAADDTNTIEADVKVIHSTSSDDAGAAQPAPAAPPLAKPCAAGSAPDPSTPKS